MLHILGVRKWTFQLIKQICIAHRLLRLSLLFKTALRLTEITFAISTMQPINKNIGLCTARIFEYKN